MADSLTGLEAELRSNGISVEEVVQEPSEVELTYVTAFPGDHVDHQEMGRALSTFVDLAEDGEWDPRRVDATVLRFEDDVLGTWYAKPEWFEGLLDYRLSETDFSERVLDTLEERP